MYSQRHSRLRLPLFIVLCSFLLVLAFSCDEPPTKVDNDPGGGMSGSGDIDPGAAGSFLLGKVTDPNFAAGYIEVWASNVQYDSAVGMVTFDLTLANFTEWPIEPAIHFVITSIVPGNITIVGIDGETRDGFPYYDFSDKLGPDKVLDIGETSEPKTAKFHMVEPRSFSIGFRIDLKPIPDGAMIAGVVFNDWNRNGIRDRCKDESASAPDTAGQDYRCELGIPNITVRVDKPLSDGSVVHLITRTDQNGEFRFEGFGQGVYKVSVHPPLRLWEITSANPLLVTLVKGPDGVVQDFYGANFGLYPIVNPGEQTLFGPVLVGPMSPNGTLLDSTFADTTLSILPVIYHHYLEIVYPPFERWPIVGDIDTVSAWINGELVFDYSAPEPPDSLWFEPAPADTNYWFMPETVKLRDGLVQHGENDIRLFVDGSEHSALMFRVYKKP